MIDISAIEEILKEAADSNVIPIDLVEEAEIQLETLMSYAESGMSTYGAYEMAPTGEEDDVESS